MAVAPDPCIWRAISSDEKANKYQKSIPSVGKKLEKNWEKKKKSITCSVDGVDGGDGHADPGGTEQDDGKLGQVGQDHSEHLSAFESHPHQGAAETPAQVAHLVVRVLPSSDAAFLNRIKCGIISPSPESIHLRAGE